MPLQAPNGRIAIPVFSGVFKGLLLDFFSRNDIVGQPLITALALFNISGLILFLSVALVGIGFTKIVKKKVGGMTGDLFGFLCEIVEVLTMGGLVCLNHP